MRGPDGLSLGRERSLESWEVCVSRLMPLDDLLSVDIDMEFMCVPRRVHNLDLAELLPPFVLGFHFFDRARLGGQRRLDASHGLVGREGPGALIVVRMRRHHHAPGGEQQHGQEAHKSPPT